MAKNASKTAEETVYDHPSEKYPDVKSLGLGKTAAIKLRTLSGLLVQLGDEIKPLEARKKEVESEIQEILEAQGYENGLSFWNQLPINMFRGSNTQLKRDKLVELGVSADIIAKATVTTPNTKLTVQVIRPRGPKD